MAYNHDVVDAVYIYGKKNPVACKIKVPAIGCIIVERSDGYGSGEVQSYVVLRHRLSKKRVTALQIASIVAIDIGMGPEHLANAPGQLRYATDNLCWLKIQYHPTNATADYRGYSPNAYYEMGQYSPMDIGFDK